MALFSRNGFAPRFTLPTPPAPPRPAPPPPGPPPVPAEVVVAGARAVYSGPGRAPGCHLYCDLAARRFHDLYLARVVRRDARYALAEVPGNPGVGLVIVPDAACAGLAAGGWVLVGPLQFAPAGGPATAAAAWPVAAAAGPEATGTVADAHPVHPYGWIAADDGRRFFVHASELAAGLTLRPGLRVRFTVATNREGWKAVAVRAA